jgi:hypothetical protein
MSARADTTLPKVAAVFSIASVLANLAALWIGTGRGLAPPMAFDFGRDVDLIRLAAEHSAHVLPLSLSLLSPCLGIPAGLGWFHILRGAGWPAVVGLVMFLVGMIFVVLLDILELIVIVRLAPAYGVASEAVRPALLGVTSALELMRAPGLRWSLFQFRSRAVRSRYRDPESVEPASLAWLAVFCSGAAARLAGNTPGIVGAVHRSCCADWNTRLLRLDVGHRLRAAPMEAVRNDARKLA